MSDRLTLTPSRPDYGSGSLAVYGSLPAKVPSSYPELLSSPELEIVSLGLNFWPSAPGPDTMHALRATLAGLSSKPLAGLAAFNDLELAYTLPRSAALGLMDRKTANALKVTLDKADLYATLMGHGVCVPKYIRASTEADIVRAIADIDLPFDRIILKPAAIRGSVGVYRLRLDDDLARVAAVAKTAAATSRVNSDVVVMEYVDGSLHGSKELCAEGLAVDGQILICVVHLKVAQNARVVFQDRLMVTSTAAHVEVAPVVQRVWTALGLGSGTFHMEFRVGPDGQILPIDIAARPGGGFIAESVKVVTGADLRVAHIFAQLDKLSALSLTPSSPQAAVAAIGTFYAIDRRAVDFERLHAIGTTLSTSHSLVAYQLISEVTNSRFHSPDGGLSLCVRADSASAAIQDIRDIAEKVGFA